MGSLKSTMAPTLNFSHPWSSSK